MVELAKTHISISDESSAGASSNVIIPLYVFATEQDKLDESGKIAEGTIKSNAKKLSIVTSRKNVIEQYGIPSFTVVDGTVQQADELNEVGLFGLYDGMGSAAVGYALRADIDLKQLKPTKNEPTSNAKAGTVWLDTFNSRFGFFVSDDNSSSAKRWREIEFGLNDIEIAGEGQNAPTDDKAKAGKYCIFVKNNKFTFYEGKETTQGDLLVKKWVEIKTTDDADWKEMHTDAELHIASSKTFPTGNQGSIWIKTDKGTNGMNLALKSFSGTKQTWVDLEYNVVSDLGNTTTPIAVVYEDDKVASFEFKKYDIEKQEIQQLTVEITADEPRENAIEGTLWYDDSYMSETEFASKYVIKCNDGQNWEGYEKAIYVRSSDPIEDGEADIDGILWIDTDGDEYPCIYRRENSEWVLIDNSDQSTPDGIVFGNKEIDAQSYPKGILLYDMDLTSRVVKKADGKGEWSCESGCEENGMGLFGAKAQRKVIVRALAEAINSNDDIKTLEYDFMYACCPGYPELDDELIRLNNAKKDIFMIVSDTPKRLAPKGVNIQNWGTDANNAPSHGEDGRKLKNAYVTRQYPPMGLTSNVDGYEVAVPSSIAAMRNLLSLSRGQIPAGTQTGQVVNLASVGYITDEDEYSSVSVNDGLGESIVNQSINPIMSRRNTGLLFWGEATENPNVDSILAREHGIITLIRLKRELEAIVQPFFFRINNESTRNEFNYALNACLTSFVSTGEIYDFAVVTDKSVNTNERINRNELWADIAISITRGIEQIYLPIRIVATGSL